MTLFNKVFSTRTLLQIICVLGAVVAMKAERAMISAGRPRWRLNEKTVPTIAAQAQQSHTAQELSVALRRDVDHDVCCRPPGA